MNTEIILDNKVNYKDIKSVKWCLKNFMQLKTAANNTGLCVYADMIKAIKKLDISKRWIIYKYYVLQYEAKELAQDYNTSTDEIEKRINAAALLIKDNLNKGD